MFLPYITQKRAALRLLSLYVLQIVLLLGVVFYEASASGPGDDVTIEGAVGAVADRANIKNPGISDVILRIVAYMVSFVGILAVAAIIIGGIMYILSLGDESKATRAKKIVLYAIIGVILVGVSTLILTVIKNTILK